MLRFIKDFFTGEPVMFVGIISTALTAWQAALIAANMTVPLALAIVTPVWVAVGAFYTRSKVSPG